MAEIEPALSMQDMLLLQQGLQKIINECNDHRDALLKGQQSADKDPLLYQLSSLYQDRKASCHALLRKLPLLPVSSEGSPLKNMQA